MPPKMSNADGNVSKAGISTSANGERVIASSTRADGSVRKEIRVRPGYRPPEDVEIYKNRTAEAYKSRGKGPVPGSEMLDAGKDDGVRQASNKNAKRREARKKAATTAADTKEDAGDSAKGLGAENALPNGSSTAAAAETSKDPEAEKEKEAKKLSKKLRQARELQDKKDKGDSLLPEQLGKIIRINELIKDLDKLGFGPDGERKKEQTNEDDTG